MAIGYTHCKSLLHKSIRRIKVLIDFVWQFLDDVDKLLVINVSVRCYFSIGCKSFGYKGGYLVCNLVMA